MNTFASEIHAAGYVMDPNHADCWYAGSGGLPTFKYPHKIQVLSDRIRVFTLKFFGEHYTRKSWHDEVTVAIFDSVSSFLAACPDKSEAGVSFSYFE